MGKLAIGTTTSMSLVRPIFQFMRLELTHWNGCTKCSDYSSAMGRAHRLARLA